MDPLLGFGLTIFMIYTIYYYIFIVKPTKLYFSDDSVHKSNGIPQSLHKYYPTFFFPNRHLQTVGSKFFRVKPEISFTRELVTTEDDGEIAIDWAPFSNSSKDDVVPTIIVLHGLVGSSSSKYVRHNVAHLADQGWRVVAVNARGCGTSELKTPITFNATNTNDLRQVLKHVINKHPESPLFAVAFSLGANLLTKYLGEEQANTPLQAAICISNPFNLWGINTDPKQTKSVSFKLYNRALALDLKNYFKRHFQHFQNHDGVNSVAYHEAKTICEYDEMITIKLLNYDSVEEYYTAASCMNYVEKVKIPVIFINSEDDPLIPGRFVPTHQASQNPNVLFAMTSRGGHIAYLKNFKFWSVSWSDRVCAEYIQMMLSKPNIEENNSVADEDDEPLLLDPLKEHRQKTH